jgi:hypothetical protein
VAALYAPDAVFWATYSDELRTTPVDVKNYFDWFCEQDYTDIQAEKSYFVRVLDEPKGTLATNDGSFKLSFTKADGSPGTANLRFSFMYRRAPGTQDWKIILHHNSVTPARPAGLRPVV